MLSNRLSPRHLLATSLLLLTWAACAPQPEAGGPDSGATEAAESTEARAQRLAQELTIVDTHIDLPYRLQKKMEDVSVRTESGDFDFVRAGEGGLNAPFMSIYVPPTYQIEGGAKEFADQLIDGVETLATEHPEAFVVVDSIEEIAAAKQAGQVALALGIENGAPIEDDLANVQHFYDRGVRYITLTHSKNNQICDSSYESVDGRQWNGLSPFGREVVAEMNRVGIMVDVSHVSDDTFYQVIEMSRAPVIASHSSVRHFTPGFERNMDDAMIKALAENGGVIQINFGTSFLTAEGQEFMENARAEIMAHAAEQGWAPGSPELEAYVAQYRAEHTIPYAPLSAVVDHIDHVVQLVGIDHVGLGSDFDGVGDSLPIGLKDTSQYPNLIAALLEQGYDDTGIEKILSGNLFRVWSEVAAVAASGSPENASATPATE